jgi:mRNA interferase RelE/StbE
VGCWKIEFTIKANKLFKKLDLHTQKLIENYIDNEILSSSNPRDKGKALTGNKKGLWRYRVNKYRIVCRIQDEILIILVVKIGKRDEIYED